MLRTTVPEQSTSAREPAWLILAFQMPPQPGYLRVKAWRRLQSVGAVSFRNALYVLPKSEDALEDLTWILREIQAGGGGGAIFEANAVEGLTDKDLRCLFNDAREKDYRSLVAELRDSVSRTHRRRAVPDEPSAETQRFRQRFSEIEKIDFFSATGREIAEALLQKLEQRTVDSSPAPPMRRRAKAKPQLKSRTWVTRADVHVDRMASAWLIKRWIDPQARFKFVTDRHYRPEKDELRFDMYEAEYTHDAERCTFEVLLDVIGRKDRALKAIAEIVHDLDLKDRKYEREETAGVKQILSGIIASHANDEDRLERGYVLFGELYRSFAPDS